MIADLELFTFVNDIHEEAPNELAGFRNCYNPSDKNEYYIGDNIDLINCKKKDVARLQARINELRLLYGDRFITGNHEAQRDSDRLVIIKPGVAVMHGDLIFWGKEKSEKYRRKDHGAGFLKRGLWVNALEAFEAGYDREISEEDIHRFIDLCHQHNVHTIIVGHMHPKVQKILQRADLTLIVLKRGVTTLRL